MEDVKEKEAQAKALEDKVVETISNAVKEHVPGIVNEAVGAKMDATIKELGLDKIDLKHGNFPGLPANDPKTNKKERIGKFIKAVYQKDMESLASFSSKGMVEGVDSQGGFIVPEEMFREINRIVENVGLIPRLSRTVPMASDTLLIPKKDTDATVQWVGEATEGSDGSPLIQQVKIEARTQMGLSPVSRQLLEDGSVDIVDYLMELFAEAMAADLDFQGLQGVGTPFTGILNETAVPISVAGSGATTVAALTLPDWRAAMTPLKVAELSGAVWVMHKTVWEAIQTIQEGSQTVAAFSTNNQLTSPEVTGGVLMPVGTLWSHPVWVSDQMPDVASIATGEQVAIFGNFRNFFIGNRREMSMETSDQASMVIGGSRVNAFTSDQRIVKVTQRKGLKMIQENGFTVLETA